MATGLRGSDVGADHVSLRGEFTGTGMNALIRGFDRAGDRCGGVCCRRVTYAPIRWRAQDSADHEVIADCRDEPEGLS
jgi:hypothetical protein